MAVDGDSYLGVDLGTSGIKLVLIGVDGTTLAESEASYPVLRPQPGWVEGDPDGWWQAFTTAVGSISPALHQHPPRAMAVDGQMHGVVLCDEVGRPVRHAVLWPDRRAESSLSAWRSLPASARARLANPLVPGMYGPILAWLAEHEPDVVEHAHVALLSKDVLRARMGGGIGTDRSDASATLLWDVPGDTWAKDVATAAGVPSRLLPTVHGSDEPVGVTSVLADLVPGGAHEVPLAAGAGDTPAALLATGLGRSTLINLGSGAQVMQATPRPQLDSDPLIHAYADASDGWYAMAAVQNGGLALQWALNMLGMDWAQVAALADSPETASSVSFLPFLTGERGGVAAPDSRGAWLGMDATTTREDLARAAVEAMLFTVRAAVELLPNRSGDDAVLLTGGGGRTAQIQQLLADLLRRPVRRVEIRSASATGAAMLAGRALDKQLQPRSRVSPDIQPRSAEHLEDRYLHWRDRRPAALM